MRTILLLLITFTSFAQQNPNELTYDEFLGYVKKFHPAVKQSNLTLSEAQANLMMARGGFDPKIEVDFNEKQFKNTEYYSILNSSFKIPTWYGIEIKAGFDNSEGIYVNPENTTPNSGLTSLGITVPVGQGLFINQRMADLRRAKIQVQLSQAERKLEAIEVLYEASVAYFNWKRSFDERMLYETYHENAKVRYRGVVQLIEQGDQSAIDSIEAGITVKTRLLNLEDAKLKLLKSRLELSNFLWLDNNVPLELSEEMIPEANLDATVEATLRTNDLLQTESPVANHPKLNALQSKIELLDVERRFKANLLLPKIDLGYHYLSEPRYFDNYQFEDYKFGVNFSFPIFLRKERGSLQLTKLKLQDARLDLELEKLQLNNKIEAQKAEISNLAVQKNILDGLVQDYSTMLSAEERMFLLGESSLFLINSRENNLVTSQLSKINLENRYFLSNATLFRIMANPD
ncbi:outer membrane protein TolC [Flavobacterium arsenatis]|uniref:Outer membrane protein TolC n=1 Tax=Flavobacterium arsenatis TaxID=1484332 RepID=A0ABU1TLQ2_9FLAO|nr:TolC family protein [Flavobacterium arsenatis]MDR6966901.1 outer membrane protein TolC [Flavobacterium arsenatis]